LNTFYKASEKEPVHIMAADFDGNGTIDPVLGYFIKGKLVPSSHLSTMSNQMPFVRNIYPDFTSYSKATFENLLPDKMTVNALKLQATELGSGYLENDGANNFNFKPFPLSLQTSVINGFNVDTQNHKIYLDQNTTEDEANLGVQDAGGYFHILATKKGPVIKPIRQSENLQINDGIECKIHFSDRFVLRKKKK
jgi:enediyne biosynthesis protein E4